MWLFEVTVGVFWCVVFMASFLLVMVAGLVFLVLVVEQMLNWSNRKGG